MTARRPVLALVGLALVACDTGPVTDPMHEAPGASTVVPTASTPFDLPITSAPAGLPPTSAPLGLPATGPELPGPSAALANSIQLAAAASSGTDIVWRNTSTGANAVWEMDGTDLVSGQTLLTVADQNWVIGGLADFNGDSKTDILWRNGSTGANTVWLMDQNTILSGLSLLSVPDPAWIIGGIGDFDGDGKGDIVWRNTSTGANSLWLMDGSTIKGGETLLTVADLDWKLRGVGDANGNGKPDMVWRNTATGANALWDMDGITILSGANITTVADMNWDIGAFADMTGDGKSDLIWRNSATGANAIWQMDAHSLVSGLTTVAVADAAWKIVGAGDLFGVTTPAVNYAAAYLVGGFKDAAYSASLPAATGGNGTFTYTVTNGALPTGLSLNSSTGGISGTPTVAGMAFFEVTASSGGQSATAIFSITISNNASTGFNLWAVNVASSIPSAAIRTQIDAALARWEAVVVGNVSSYTLGADATCSGNAIVANAFIEDVLILVDIAFIDGPFNTLGSAGPCLSFNSAPKTLAGKLTLDSADLDSMSASALFGLVFHEIGHIMGIGTHWTSLSLISGDGGPDPRFLGATANAEYATLGGSGNIPIEADGGDGTAYGHWDEGVFDTEMMTGYSEGGSELLSRMTIASLADMSWTVSYSTADSYSLPACRPNCTAIPAFPTPWRWGGPGVEVAPDWDDVVVAEDRSGADRSTRTPGDRPRLRRR